jgi:hypothetical protein
MGGYDSLLKETFLLKSISEFFYTKTQKTRSRITDEVRGVYIQTLITATLNKTLVTNTILKLIIRG